ITPPENASWTGADLTIRQQVLDATKGSSVIYMCAGLKYDRKIWQLQWPLIMQHIIDATKANNARLIFFDNVYMYGHVNGAMTEKTPFNTSSVKGKVRAKIAEQLLGEMKAGNIRASIARAADFYGTNSQNSFFDSMVLDKFSKKSRAMWLGNASAKHSFTYIPDAAKAVVLLGTHPDSDNQTWHLPTAPALTGVELIKMAADIFNTRPAYMQIKKLMLGFMGIFSRMIGETSELYYQNKYDYIFDSKKFEDYFNVKPTSYAEGIKAVSELLLKPKL
ncbi:MAG: NAD-dependent epimerase/dehydratase family protein, partial [Chitinophagaceae bacterium]